MSPSYPAGKAEPAQPADPGKGKLLAFPAQPRPATEWQQRAVFDVAARLYLTDGPDGVTPERVAAAAGLAVAQVQKISGSKQELIATARQSWYDLALVSAMWTWCASCLWTFEQPAIPPPPDTDD